MYGRVQAVSDRLLCILDNTIRLSGLGGAAASATATMPLSEMRKAREYNEYLPLAVVLPGCLCIGGLLLSAGCFALSPKTHCLAKLMHFLNFLILTTALVFYSLFAALGAVIDFDVAQQALRQITGTCDTTIPLLQQTDVDVHAQLEMVRSFPAGTVSDASLADLTASYDNAHASITIFTGTCGCLDELFQTCSRLYSPSIVCFFAVLMCFYASGGMCCAARCCGSVSTAKVDTRAK